MTTWGDLGFLIILILVLLIPVIFAITHFDDILLIANELYSIVIKLVTVAEPEPAPIVEIIPEPEPEKKGMSTTTKVVIVGALVSGAVVGGVLVGVPAYYFAHAIWFIL